MLPKPEACKGCPWYGDGQGFVPDELYQNAKITFIGQNPGEMEEAIGRPLVGRSGSAVVGNIEKYGLTRESANWMNVMKCRWQHTNDLPPGKETGDAAAYCFRVFFRPAIASLGATNVFVPLGDVALNWATGKDGIDSWRGSVFIADAGPLAGKKFLPTIHPSAVFRDPTWRTASKSDFARIVRECRRVEKCVDYVDNFRMGVGSDEFVATLKALSGRRVALDIETTPEKAIDAKLKIIGIGWSPVDAMNYVYGQDVVGDMAVLEAIEAFDGEWIAATPFDYSKLTHLGVKFKWGNCHDLTLLHSRFDIELAHTVAFICSMWTEREFWKYLAASEPLRYNCLDCVAEWEAFDRLWAFCTRRDPAVIAVYERDRQMEIVATYLHLNGFPVDDAAFKKEKEYYEGLRDSLEADLLEEFKPSGVPTEPPRCERHPRYSGKSPLRVRKGEEGPCGHCAQLSSFVRDSRPLKLTQRKRLAGIFRAEGIKLYKNKETGKESLAKGKVAKMYEDTGDPRLLKLLEFWEEDTVVTRYFKDTKKSKGDGRVHSSWWMHGAMHRWHSTDPNMQQLKKPEMECSACHKTKAKTLKCKHDVCQRCMIGGAGCPLCSSS